MTSKAELAFRALDKDNSGFVTEKEFKNLSSKLGKEETTALMRKVRGSKFSAPKFVVNVINESRTTNG